MHGLSEFREELIPTDFLEGIGAGVTGEVEAEDPCVTFAAGAFDAGGVCAAFFCPLTNLVMIGGGLGAT